jgi:hypothetical protein
MQPYGKIVEIRNSCMCCGTSKCSRADAKIELRKIINQEMLDWQSYKTDLELEKLTCGVCGKYDDPECIEGC